LPRENAHAGTTNDPASARVAGIMTPPTARHAVAHAIRSDLRERLGAGTLQGTMCDAAAVAITRPAN
jgi:hypothetical protein